MSNKGIEVMLNLDVIRNKSFNWNTSINLSHNKNEITKLSNDLFSTSRVYVGDPWIRGASGVTSHVVEEGYPVGQFFMLKCNGMMKTVSLLWKMSIRMDKSRTMTVHT